MDFILLPTARNAVPLIAQSVVFCLTPLAHTPIVACILINRSSKIE